MTGPQGSGSQSAGTAWPGAGGPPGADPDAVDAQLRERAAAAVAEQAAGVNADPWRQDFHVQPPVGLLNDPNGVVQHRGVYHLCYQWHPFAPEHKLKFWAHLTSTDLVHWEDQPVALTPSHPYDSHGCYSGSGIVYEDAVHFVYTGNVRTPDGGRTPYQVVARLGDDGRVVTDPANPVVGPVPGCTGHVRDPKVWSEAGQHWMVLGAQTDDLHGTVLLLRAPGLTDWTVVGAIAGGPAEPLGYMWECPDLLRMPGGDVLVISPQFDHGGPDGPERWEDRTLYAVGTLTLEPPRFQRSGDFLRMDAGPDFYAPQSFAAEDGRRIVIGWMGMPDHDGQPPLAVKHPTVANGWVHCLTVPRVVELVDGVLVQQPVAELEVLRGEPVAAPALHLEAEESASLAGAAGESLDLVASVATEPGGVVAMRLREGDAGRPVVLRIDPNAGVATLDRSLLGTGEGGAFTGSFRPAPRVDVRILLDHSSIEVFVDGGRLVLSARIYPVPGDDLVCIDAEGAAADVDLTVWPMAPA